MSTPVGVVIHDLLLANAAVQAIVGTRVRPGPLRGPDEPVGALPTVTYQRVGTIRREHFLGRSHPSRVRMQVDCWAADHDAAEELFDVVRLALDMKTSSTHFVQKIAIVDGSDQYLPEPDVKLARFTADYYVDLAEAVA